MQNSLSTAVAAKIVTVTANTAIDYVIEVNNLCLGDNLIAQKTVKFASGKGINVAKAVASLACPVQIMGFVGSKSLALFEELNSELITADYTFVEGETRTNITLSDSQKQQETHIRTAGFSVTAADCQSLITALAARIAKNDIVVLSGSLPNNAPADLYQTLINVCHRKAAIAFLDSSGESLRLGMKAKPYLIKPNKAEFEALVGCSLDNENELIFAAREIIASGVKWVVISKAEQGALMISENIALSAAINNADNDNIISHIGCGDALLAGLAFAKLQGYDADKMLKLAVASGTANLFSAEPGSFRAEKLALIMEQVQILRCR